LLLNPFDNPPLGLLTHDNLLLGNQIFYGKRLVDLNGVLETPTLKNVNFASIEPY
jgi:hypothetical protein